MATYNRVYVLTRYANAENARRKNPNTLFRTKNQGKVYKKVWCGAMRGKIKDFILSHKTLEEHHGENFNGYGYADKYNEYFLSSADGKVFLEIVTSKQSEKPAKTWEQVRDEWAKRLVRLLDGVTKYEWVDIDFARLIAQEKEEYKSDQIYKMQLRQSQRYSVKRAALIRKMERENPLRRIKDIDHAIAIVQASRRHNNSDYENLLDYYREEAELGLIDRSDVKELARNNMHYEQ